MNRALIIKSFYPELKLVGDSKADDIQLMRTAVGRIGKDMEMSCGLAGTVFRFLALRCSREKGQHILVGENRLFERPLTELMQIFNQLSVKAEIRKLTDNKSALVIASEGWQLQGNALNVSVKRSSQFASAVLLSAWDLPFKLFIRFDMNQVDQMPSFSYYEMTKSLLVNMGMVIKGSGQEIEVPAHQNMNKKVYLVEPDMSTALSIAALGVVGGNATILNFPVDSLQPDYIFPSLLESMGVTTEFKYRNGETRLFITAPAPLMGIKVDLKDYPDLFPVLAVLCALAKGKSSLRGAGHLKFKESDRINKISELLNQIGRKHEVFDDGIEILGEPSEALCHFSYDTDFDHRLAMAAGVLKLYGHQIDVLNPDVVSKSFPEFWSLM
jgi:3-phosphoshikimate 1-carboxyvinyltransferase